MASEIKLPKVFQEIGFASLAEQVPGLVINNLPDKMFAVASYDWDATTARAEQLYSHLHWGHTGVSSQSKQWDTIRWYGGTVEQLVANTPSADGFGVVSEVTENLTSAGRGAEAQGFVDTYFRKLMERSGKSSPADTNFVGDYWQDMNMRARGIQILLNQGNPDFWNAWTNRFASEAGARLNVDNQLSQMFVRNLHETQNWRVPGYNDGFHRIPEHTDFYTLFACVEQMHLAARLKTIQFATDMLEGAEWKINRYSSMQGTRFENPAGIMFRSSLNNTPSELMYRDGFLMSTLGDGIMHWGAAGRSTTNIKRWVRSYNGGFAESKTQWLKDGGTAPVNYNPNDSSMPAKSPGDNPNNYTGSGVEIIPPGFGGPGPFGGHDSLAGRYMASLIRGKHTKLKWPKFEYKLNGTTKSGYYNGNDPVLGTLGDGSVSTMNNRNFGQHNIVNQLRYKLPVLIKGEDVAVWCNPTARMNDVQRVTIDDGGLYEFEVVGPNMKVFDL